MLPYLGPEIVEVMRSHAKDKLTRGGSPEASQRETLSKNKDRFSWSAVIRYGLAIVTSRWIYLLIACL